MTPDQCSRAQAHKNSDYESPDEFEFSNSRAGPSVSRRSSNEVIRLVRPAPIARGTTAEADKMTQRRCILTVLGKAPPPPKPMVRGRGTAQRKQHRGHNGRLPGTTPIGGPWTECPAASRTRKAKLSLHTTQPPTSEIICSEIAQLSRTAQRGRHLRL
jgi:hypothetical protein